MLFVVLIMFDGYFCTEFVKHNRFLIIESCRYVRDPFHLVSARRNSDGYHPVTKQLPSLRKPMAFSWCQDREAAYDAPDSSIPLPMLPGANRFAVISLARH